MGLASELIPHENKGINELINALSDNYEIAYGDTYSIGEIRKAINDGQPAFAKVHNETLFFVGANPGGLVIHRNGELFEVEDRQLQKAWSGNAVIVTDKIAPSPETQEVEAEEQPDMVIFASERDSYSNEALKNDTKKRASKINQLPHFMLPKHPVVLYFKDPDDKQAKEEIRGMVNGAEICIYDIDDPITVFFHELGHVYWRTQLSDEDRQAFKELHSKLGKQNLPSIFTSQWSVKDAEEMFCTIYLWHMKGMCMHNGYCTILSTQFAVGYNRLQQVFSRIRDSVQESLDREQRFQKAQNHWQSREKSLALWLNRMSGQSSVVSIDGRRLRKAKMPAPRPGATFFSRDVVKHDPIASNDQREWVRVLDGFLKGKVLPIRNNFVDLDYIASKKARYKLVPVTRTYKARVGSGQVKEHARTVFVDPDKEPGHLINEPEAEPAALRKAQEWLKERLLKLGSKAN